MAKIRSKVLLRLRSWRAAALRVSFVPSDEDIGRCQSEVKAVACFDRIPGLQDDKLEVLNGLLVPEINGGGATLCATDARRILQARRPPGGHDDDPLCEKSSPRQRE